MLPALYIYCEEGFKGYEFLQMIKETVVVLQAGESMDETARTLAILLTAQSVFDDFGFSHRHDWNLKWLSPNDRVVMRFSRFLYHRNRSEDVRMPAVSEQSSQQDAIRRAWEERDAEQARECQRIGRGFVAGGCTGGGGP
jgi:hypothetical protein